MEYLSTEPEDISQDIVTLTDRQEEFSHVTQHTESEAQGAVETFSVSSKDPQTETEFTRDPSDNVSSSDVLTTPTIHDETTNPTQSSGQEAESDTTVFEIVPEFHLPLSHNEPPVDDHETENHTEELHTVDYEHLSKPDATVEPGENVEYTTDTQSISNTTSEDLKTIIQETGGDRHVMYMPVSNLDNQTESHDDEYDELSGNLSVSVDSHLDYQRTTQSISLDTTEGADDDLSTVYTEKVGHLVTQDQVYLHGRSSAETITASPLFTNLSHSTLGNYSDRHLLLLNG